MKKPEVSIVIPAYNESETIKKVLDDIKKVLSETDIQAEIIVVNDGSKDNTRAIIEKIKGIRVINHPYNLGYGASLKTGAKNAEGEYVLYLDADGQHDPKDIPKLLRYRKEYDMVVGKRGRMTSLVRTPAKKLIGMFANYLVEKKIPDLNSGFRVIRKDLIMRYIHILPQAFSFTTTITLASFKGGHTVKYVPIRIRKRAGGTSTIHPIKDTVKFIMLLFRATMLFSPLRVFLPAALLIFICGITLLSYELIRYFNVGTMSVLLVLTSVLIFFFGLLADQIAQIRRSG